jgi:hypothetical protein
MKIRIGRRILHDLRNGILKISVADPDHFYADPDPTSEKTGCGSGSDHALYKVL